jgi:TRAP-type uncharacterized transport system substrate-binding protein
MRMRDRVAAATLSRLQRSLRRELWLGIGLAALLAGLAFALALHFVEPAPPRHVVLSTGPADSGYHAFALRYREILARDGVTLELRTSQGSLDNVGRLMDAAADVDAGFLQGGTSFAVNAPGLVSLGSLYYEPLWVFYRGREIDDLTGLRGRKIAIGPDFSGVRTLALQLLAVNDVVLPPTELLPLGGDDAANALLAHAVDAAMFVAPGQSPTVERLIHEPGVRLLSFERGEAYTRRFPYLTRLTLPEGTFDLARNVPRGDVILIAPTANLLVRNELHPALAYLFMRVATQLHGEAGLFNRRGEFPNTKDADFPLSPEAQRYYASGTPFLQRYLPYWAANLVDRLWVMLLPVLAVVVPLVRVLPPLYSWRMRSRIYRWYARLKEIELQLERATAQDELNEMLAGLTDIEAAVNHIATPLAYSANLYSFRQHIDLVRGRVLRRLKGDRREGSVKT